MGSQNQRSSGIDNFDQYQWERVSPNLKNYSEQYGEFTSYKHTITNEEIDKYVLHFASQHEQRNYYDCSLQRMREDYIVNTIFYTNNSFRQFCSTIHQAQVYIQHIPIRLSDITDIPYPQNIYILRNCLQGFHQLYNIIGYFQPHEDLICIDNYGEVKVWMNSDLSKNFPDDHLSTLQAQKPEFIMVNHILKLIQENTDLNTCPQPISKFFAQNNYLFPTFKEALDITDQYIFKYRTIVPQYCESVLQIFKDQDSQFKDDTLFKNADCIMEEQPEIVIGETVIPKLEIGKKQHPKQISSDQYNRKEQRQTIKRQWSQNSHLPVNSTDRTKYIRNEQFEKQQKRSFIENNHFGNTNKIPTKQTPIQRRISNSSQSKSIRPQICFTYTSRAIKRDRESEKKQQLVMDNTHQDASKMFKYSTGCGQDWQDLDPEIAADLSNFLE